MSSSRIERKLAAIMFTDIAGYTALSAKDETKALELLDTQKQILTPIIEEFNGTLHKEMGDGLLFTFPTVTEAVKCGIKIQEETKANDDLNLRVGIHEGEITLKDGDALGDDVNVASRIEAFAPSGGIAISSKVQQNISSLPEFETTYVGKPELKGVSQEVKVYCIISHGLPESKKIVIKSKLKPGGKFYKEIIISTFFGIILFTYLSNISNSDFNILKASLFRSSEIKNPITGELKPTKHGEDVKNELSLADSLLKMNNLSDNLETITITDILINEDSTQGDFYSLKGIAFLQRAQIKDGDTYLFNESKQYLNKAIKSKNINIDYISRAYMAFSDIYLFEKNIKSAEVSIKKALRANKKNKKIREKLKNINRIKLQ